MSHVPRIAVGTVQADVALEPMLWALFETFRRQDMQVQSFLSRACFAHYQSSASITGVQPRHLDSWIMSADACREVFLRNTEHCDLALVEGRFSSSSSEQVAPGGKLEALCQWLDLPVLAVVDVSQIRGCRTPPLPRADGLLLDCVPAGQVSRVATSFEALWGIPVVGALETLPALRQEIARTAPGQRPSPDLIRELGNHFADHWWARRMDAIATRREIPGPPPHLFGPERANPSIVVALAYDDVFNCYFPDTLDLLEWQGAKLVDFSPLRDDRLPSGADVVYLGCGHPENFADQLAHNHCMKVALRDHLRNGGRIYAEGGGLAYLCEYMETVDHTLHRMVGLFPAVARPIPAGHGRPDPVELTLDRTSWFGPAGSRVRGYRNTAWYIEQLASAKTCLSIDHGRSDLLCSAHAIGSQLNLHLAAQPNLLSGFFGPPLPPQAVLDPWASRP